MKTNFAYVNSKMTEIYAEEGIVFVVLEHNTTHLVFKTFLSEFILKKPIYINQKEIDEGMKKLHEYAEKNKKIFMEITVYLEIQQDLIKIFKEYI